VTIQIFSMPPLFAERWIASKLLMFCASHQMSRRRRLAERGGGRARRFKRIDT
jgi:hypothetical protein